MNAFLLTALVVSQPPPRMYYQAPPIDERLAVVEAKVERIEAKLDAVLSAMNANPCSVRQQVPVMSQPVTYPVSYSYQKPVSVVTGQTFRGVRTSGVVSHAGHNCPNCGAYQNEISGYSGGDHLHTCSNCGTTWKHPNNGGMSVLNSRYAAGRPFASVGRFFSIFRRR